VSKGRGPRPHSGHRKRRRRGSGRPQAQPPAPVRLATVRPTPDCHPDMPCNWHGICSKCGDLIHLAGGEMSPGFGPYGVEELARLVLGDPPVCSECRGGSS